MDEERLIILRRIELGDISVADGMKILDAIEGRAYANETTGPQADETGGQDDPAGEPLDSPSVEVLKSDRPADRVDMRDPRWKAWSWITFGIFVLLTAMSAVWMAQGWMFHPWSWGFWLAWIPFLVGVLGMIATYNARWLHVRIQQAPGERPQRIAISLPLPLGLVSFILPFVSRWVPAEVNGQDLGELIHEMNNSLSGQEPLHVLVDDQNGRKVEVYIG